MAKNEHQGVHHEEEWPTYVYKYGNHLTVAAPGCRVRWL